MHPLRAPFALLATTFVTAVLATPLNGPARVASLNATDLFNSIGAAYQGVEIVNEDIAFNLTFGFINNVTTQMNILNEISTAGDNMNQSASLVQAAGTISDIDCQTLVDFGLKPLYDTLNDAVTLTIKLDVSAFFNQTTLALTYRSALTDMSLAKDNLELAVKTKFTPPTAEQMDTIFTNVNSNFVDAINIANTLTGS